MKIRPDKKSKIIDVLIIGNGPYAVVMADILTAADKAVHIVPDAVVHSVRCIKPGVYTTEGRRYSTKATVIIMHPRLRTPAIAGLEKTPYLTDPLELVKTAKQPGSVMISMIDNTALSGALELSEKGFTVDVVSADTRPLAQFDPSVSDYMKHVLKLRKVKFSESTTPLSAIKTGRGTYLVTVQDGAPKRFKAEYLVVQPHGDEVIDIGLQNAGIKSIASGIFHQDVLNRRYGQITYINPQAYVTLSDLQYIAKQVLSKLLIIKKLKYVPVHLFAYGDVDFISVGVNEAALLSAHAAYNKAFVVIKDPLTGKQSGFIKLLAHYTGKLIGVSCVHKGANEFVPLWVDAIKHRDTAQSVLPLLVPGAPIAEAYLEALGEL